MQSKPATRRPVEPIYGKLGKLIAKRREELGMSKTELAKKIKVSRPSVFNMEAGRQRIYFHDLYVIEKVLGFPPGEMITKGFK